MPPRLAHRLAEEINRNHDHLNLTFSHGPAERGVKFAKGVRGLPNGHDSQWEPGALEDGTLVDPLVRTRRGELGDDEYQGNSPLSGIK